MFFRVEVGAAALVALGYLGSKLHHHIDAWGGCIEERERLLCTGHCHLCTDQRLQRSSCKLPAPRLRN